MLDRVFCTVEKELVAKVSRLEQELKVIRLSNSLFLFMSAYFHTVRHIPHCTFEVCRSKKANKKTLCV